MRCACQCRAEPAGTANRNSQKAWAFTALPRLRHEAARDRLEVLLQLWRQRTRRAVRAQQAHDVALELLVPVSLGNDCSARATRH